MASRRQRRKVKKVMHEFKHGELKAGRGRRGKVKSRRQAIAIAMSESGQSRKRRGGRKSSVSNGRKKAAGGRKASTRKASTRSASSRSTARRTTARGRKKSTSRGRKKSAR